MANSWLMAIFAATGCAGNHHHQRTAACWEGDAHASRFDHPSRDAWQRPDDILRALALAPALTVADVGAGTGYFAVRIARAVPDGAVIATDLDPAMVQHVEERARREALGNLRAVQATRSTSGLTANSIDRILVVHVWHHLADRVAYARDLGAALRSGGKLVIVDFEPHASCGPPIDHRLAPATIIAELAAAGLTAKVSTIALPDQYIIEAE